MKDHLQEVQIHQGNLFILYLEIETEIEDIIGDHLIQIKIGDIEERNIVVQDLILEALGQGRDLIRDNVSL